jgi:cytochrome c biogenesis protein CcmG, thiol:disulfide interchange protein DsbE
MLVTAGKTLVPSNPIARMFGARAWHHWLWPIVRQVGEIRKRHRLRGAAAMGVDRLARQQCCKHNAGEYFQHLCLSFSATTRNGGLSQRRPRGLQSREAYKVPLQRATRGAKSKAQFYFTQIVAAALALWLALASDPASAEPEIGKAAPPLILTTLDGSTFDLAKLRGKVVLVNYWATWCSPCRKEMPKLDAFYRRYHPKGLEIIAISIDFPRDLEKARKVARALPYPAAWLQAINDNGFGKQKAVPFTWIVDANGELRDMMIEVRDELLDSLVVPLLPR